MRAKPDLKNKKDKIDQKRSQKETILHILQIR